MPAGERVAPVGRVAIDRPDAAAAQARTADEIVTQDAGRSRARSYVTRLGSGARGEAKDRALGSSIDAAR
jgi:hypothetical protein